MAKFIRYALAAICLMASVGCLALWYDDRPLPRSVGLSLSGIEVRLESWRRTGMISLRAARRVNGPAYQQAALTYLLTKSSGAFGYRNGVTYFPIWYPAFIFALAGVGVLRFRRQFSIRSPLVATTVVAVLLGMAVIL